MPLDERIDELYRLPLSEFTAARNALAKTLVGPETKRVRALAKPTVVPWAVNQLFWHARLVYERLMKSGDALRGLQIAALNGQARRKPDVQSAAESHRKALAEAVRQTGRLAESANVHPDADDLSRTLEALSLAATRPDHEGRLTEPLRPAGFEALSGLSPAAIKPAVDSGHRLRIVAGSRPNAAQPAVSKDRDEEKLKRAAEAAARKLEEEQRAKRRRAEANVKVAERALERAKATEARARDAHEQAERDREAAQAALTAARKFLTLNF